MGLLFALILRLSGTAFETHLKSLLLIGFLGGYTTFSSFSIETMRLLEAGDVTKGLLNIFLSVVLCLGAVWCGVMIEKFVTQLG